MEKLVASFINQVENAERGLLKSMIDRLQVVDNRAFEDFLVNAITRMSGNKEKIALFPIVDPDDANYSSSDRIGYVLENLCRMGPRYLTLNPSLESLRAERIKKILLVDDSIGSGRRAIKFLNQPQFKTVRSWISYGKCRLEILAYAIYEKGRDHINKKTKSIAAYKSAMFIKQSNPHYNEDMRQFLVKYGNKTLKPYAALGYRDTLGFVVFEHGCPNNLPALFWSPGKNKDWVPLFPNRGVPQKVCEYLMSVPKWNHELDQLADIGKYRLSLNLMEQIENNRISSDNFTLVMVLGLLNKGIKRANLQNHCILTEDQIANLITSLLEWGYVDQEDRTSEMGRYVLERYAETRNRKQGKYIRQVEYLPTTFGGAPRNI